MKKILFILLFLGGVYSQVRAQSATTTTTETKSKKTRAKAGKPAEQKPGDSKKAETRTATGLKKDGTPDMRFKANKENRDRSSNVTQPSAPVQNNTTTTPAAPSRNMSRAPQAQNRTPANATSDKVFGQDAKGRTIYEGPRGGHYYINSKGNKEYVKKGQ